MYLNLKDNGNWPGSPGGVMQTPDLAGYYDLGLACFSAASHVDVVEAHMWFNLAAMYGDRRGITARSDIADQMTGREIAEAQRRARLHRERRQAGV